MTFRTTLFRAAAVVSTALVGLAVCPPAHAEEQTVVDVLKVVDGDYVVETVTVPARTAGSAADSLEKQPDVVVASPQVVYEPDAAGYDPYWDTADPQAASRVQSAWSRTRGEGQVVAVLDNAAAIEHEDLIGAVLPGIDFTDGSGAGWHGSGVAGVVAARAQNGVGSAGMAPAAKVLPVKVCADGGCPSAAIARGILWAADQGADVINMSLSGVGYSDVSAAAVQYALDKGISVVASAGNDGLNGNPVMYPAALAGVIGVSSIAPSGAPSDWAVHGWQVDLSTVGDSVLLTMPGNGYGSGTGTSFSGPAVAGAVALLRASHPGITTSDVQAALQAGSDSGTWDRAYGAGRMDVPGAMAAADRADAGVVATGSSGAVDVTWDAVPGATTYTVRVDGVARVQVTGTTTRLTGLTNGTQVAVDVQAGDGPRSKPVLATVAPSMPAVPTLHSASLRGTSTSAIVDLNASVTGTVAPRYSIIRDGVSIGSIAMALTSTPRTIAVGIGAMPTSQVHWQLRAVDTYAQVGPASNTVTTGSAVPAPPAAPTGLTGRVQDGETLLGWDDRGPSYTYQVSVGGSVVATPSTAGAALPAPAIGESRTYAVSVVDGWGQVGPAASTTVTRTLTPPAAPTMGSPTVQYGSVTVRWHAPVADGGSPVTGYTVRAYQGGSLLSTVSTGADTGSTTYGALTMGTAYTFTVTATNAIGTGATSATLDLVPTAPPGAPILGSVSPGDGSVVVRWTAPSSTGGTPITGYIVEARLTGTYTTATSTTAGPEATSAALTGLTNGATYSVTVSAVNAAGTGTGSTRSGVAPRATPVAPGTPVLVLVSRGDASVVVRWTAPADDGGSPVTGYTVRAFQNGSAVTTAAAPAGATSATVPGLTNGTAYTFAVAAVNAVGTGTDSARSAAVTPAATTTVPGTPVIGAVTAGDGSAVVSWTAPLSDGGSAITGYTVRAYVDGTLVRSFGAAPSARNITATGLNNGSAYSFSVVATNAVGTSIPSASSAPVVPRSPVTVPGVPTMVTTTAGDGSVDLEWAAPASDGGSPITGYVIEVWMFGGLWSSTTVPASPTSTTIGDLSNGIPYTFTVAATNAAGTGTASTQSAEVTPEGPAATVPSVVGIGTPTTFKATARVRWAAPSDDGGTPVTGYEVRTYRSGALVATTTAPAEATSVVVTGLTLGRAHTFAVAAINTIGTGPLSARSLAVTPRTTPGAPKVASVSAARKAAIVKWAAPASNGGAAITGWVVRAYSGGKAVKSTTVRAAARSVAVTGLTPGRSYTFRVQAKNVAGSGSWSAASKAVRPER